MHGGCIDGATIDLHVNIYRHDESGHGYHPHPGRVSCAYAVICRPELSFFQLCHRRARIQRMQWRLRCQSALLSEDERVQLRFEGPHDPFSSMVSRLFLNTLAFSSSFFFFFFFFFFPPNASTIIICALASALVGACGAVIQHATR